MTDVHRARSTTPTFTNERGPGAFTSLGSLPRRKSQQPSSARKSPTFHIHDDADDRSLSSSDEHSTTPVKNSQAALQLPPAVPFPRHSPSPSPSSSPTISSRPQPSRSSSIILPNGKPLKSSLKSSTSTLSIPTPPLETQRNTNHLHLRSRSEPSTPISHAPKNVHFPDTDIGLASIRIFSRSARPAAVSTPDDETETEAEDQPSSGFPFPKFTSPTPTFEIDTATSSVVPITNPPPHANILIESLTFSQPSLKGVNPHLSGTLLVRNLAYEKHVAVRFTLDEWQTVSEVRAQYVTSVPSLPLAFTRSKPTVGDLVALGTDKCGWDRFSFLIRLEDYAHSLGSRVLWLAARYRVHSTYPTPADVSGGGGEWWDNNNGGNYRVAFRPARPISSRVRRDTTPEPVLPSMVTLPTPSPFDSHSPLIFRHKMTSSPTKDGREKVSIPSKSGKLRLPNYAAPPVVSPVSPTSSTNSSPTHPSPALEDPTTQSRDCDSPSPASSTLSTPSASPNIAPRVMIGGHPANYAQPQTNINVDDWEWMAPSSQAVMTKRPNGVRSVTDGPAQGGLGLGGSPPGLPPRAHSSAPPGSDGLSGDSLYNAFVTRWCFAQGTAGAYHGHGHSHGSDGGILA
ncbi:carbohydrate-binding module family 21 protein [Suillus occidentalis]|nr:carbohydrate-binding module family 21 protein [Suillus occidentalis]